MTAEPDSGLTTTNSISSSDEGSARSSRDGDPPEGPVPAPLEGKSQVRIDRWLWAARFFKTRSKAGKACAAGHVKINERSVKAAKPVRPGDEVDVVTPGGRRLVHVVALADKRGPATVARTLYDDRTPPPTPEELEQRAFAKRQRGAGRPGKRDRRLLIRLRGRD
jgi:ribosome-associated heat shock protein Hsp15